MTASLLCLALAARPAQADPVDKSHDADVVATASIHAPPEHVSAWLSDLRN